MALRMTSIAAALVAGALGFAAAPSLAQSVDIPSGAYELEKTHASIVWRVKHLGLSNYTVRMTDFDIALQLDVDDPTKSSVTATVNPRSVETEYPGSKDFNAEIATNDRFFNADVHPEITFSSTRVELTGERTAKIYGILNLLGVEQEIVLDAVLNGTLAEHRFQGNRPAVGFSASGVFDRTAFGMGALAPTVVSPEVEVVVEAEFVRVE